MPRLSKIGAAALAAFGWTSGSAVSANFLVVAGGGAGGGAVGSLTYASSGGGAGGFRTSAGTSGGGASAEASLVLNPTLTYTVVVGAGGAVSSAADPTKGSDSSVSTITSAGGGTGSYTATNANRNGGSGGGGGSTGTTQLTGGTGTANQGYNGGGGGTTYGGGGGGAGQVGSTGGTSYGGNGVASSISGTSTTYAGGGGGGNSSSGPAGTGGGGSGGTSPTAGTANTGGGGGGKYGTGSANQIGANGGSGIVIISYLGAQQFSGGVVTSSGGNTIHTFTTSGTLGPVTPLSANYLVVAGGGSGGTNGGGAGGAGGFLTGSALTIDPYSTYLVTVGAGGAATGTGTATGISGSNSTFSMVSTVAVGGGYGGSYNAQAPAVGGSGGGAGQNGSTSTGALGTSGQGNAGGGTNGGAGGAGGGGGGAGGAGTNGSGTVGGNGGVGTASSISGTSTYYAGGGGGGVTSGGSGGAGGNGGGGAGAIGSTNGTSGAANTGGGGGGQWSSGYLSGAGGSGVVIISYAGSTQLMAGGVVTIAGGNVIHTFNSSGFLSPLTLLTRSLRFRSSASAYLSRTFGTPTNSLKYTVSLWLKRGTLSNIDTSFILSDSATLPALYFSTANTLICGNGANSDPTIAVFRDPAAWYHIVWVYDSANATANLRQLIYINGVQQTLNSATIALNATSWNTSGVSYRIGAQPGAGRYLDAYIAEFNFIDGQTLAPTAFGTVNSYGVWQPITYGGSYGTNGFRLPFTNNASTTTLGYDFSPQGNNWTTNNISVTAGSTYDSMTDVPTLTSATAANYAVLNPLDKGSTVSDANLKTNSGAAHQSVRATMQSPSSGLYYFEATILTTTSATVLAGIGLATSSVALTGSLAAAANAWFAYCGDVVYFDRNGTSTTTGSTTAAGSIIQIAVDMANSRAWFGINNTWYDGANGTTGNPSAGTNPTFTSISSSLFPILQTYSNTLNANFGQRPFTYTPPSGYVALNTFNL